MAKKSTSFTPPTIEEIEAYCKERKNGIDPESFWSHYETVGWVYGKNQTPIKNWKACVITWEKYRKSEQQASTPIRSLVM
jgi:hypothetical protein